MKTRFLNIGGTLIFEEDACVEGLPLPYRKMDHQDQSTASTVAALKDDFNDLLMKLVASGLMDEGEVTIV